MREALPLVGRFGLAGLANTAIGFGVIVLLDPLMGAPPALANAAGYAVGVTVGIMLNRGFVFRSQTGVAAAGARYALAALAAFALNQGVLRVGNAGLGAGPIQHLAAQLGAMASYSVALFLLCQLWVFRPSPDLRGG